MRSIPRREFLRTSLMTAVAGPTVLAACSSGSPTASPTATPTSLGELIAQRKNAGAGGKIQVFLGGADYIEGVSNYIAFGITTDGANPAPITGRDATVWISEGAGGEGAPLGPFSAPYSAYAKPDGPPPLPQGVNSLQIEFPKPGIWKVLVEAQGNGALALGETVTQVKATSAIRVPVVGQDAIEAPTATVEDARGVDPICTREDDAGKPDPCPFHAVSLDDAMKGSKPVALFVATPKFCTSRTCGPNLEELLVVADEVGKAATFVHSEVWVSDSPEDIGRLDRETEAFKAWKLDSEPWLFLIKNGKVAARFEGPLTAALIRQTLTPLV